METVQAWRERKQREVDLLGGRAADAPPPGSLDDPSAVVRAKLTLRSHLLARAALEAPDLVETNRLEGDEHPFGRFTLSWRYQRFDLQVKGPGPYPGLMEDRASVWTTDWTSSGMGAVAAVLVGLQRLSETAHVVVRHDVYFESLEVLRDITTALPHTVVPAGGDVAAAARAARDEADVVVLWSDSFGIEAPDADLAAAGEHVDHFVLDTTCYEASSPRIRRPVDAALEQGIPVVLARSHLKIDFLGVEWARLGSLVHIATPFLPKDRFDRYRTVARLAGKSRRALGASVVPLHLNPFLGDPDFHALNASRVARIESANARASAALHEGLHPLGASVRTFHHGLFVALGVFGASVGPVAVRAAGESLVAWLRGQGIAARFANSFGFDFAAVAPFRHPVTDHDELRVAIPDWPDPWVDDLVREVTAWFAAQRAAG